MKAIACTPPRQLQLPFARLHVPDIRAEAIRQGIVAQISGTTIWRWLSEDALRPWAHRSWIFPRDPDFRRKAGVVLDLYARRFEGRPLGLGEYVRIPTVSERRSDRIRTGFRRFRTPRSEAAFESVEVS
ncbi:MAG TPA: hypothetical protein VFC31_02730 [Candidatus Limnocylindria bacterium]|nr:hypothetical protein [Candidatus Limnocylindria bacterium]